MTMTQMIEATLTRRAELQAAEPTRTIYDCSKIFEIEGTGKVLCHIQYAQGATTWMRPHLRRNWELNGNRIAAAKLAKIIGA